MRRAPSVRSAVHPGRTGYGPVGFCSRNLPWRGKYLTGMGSGGVGSLNVVALSTVVWLFGALIVAFLVWRIGIGMLRSVTTPPPASTPAR